MENSQERFDAFSEKSLESLEVVESLPYSYAFENLMYDNRIARTATYDSMGKPFTLNREVSEVLGGELDHLFLISEGSVISDLKAKVIDTKYHNDNPQLSVALSFDTGNMAYKISGDLGQPLTCERESYGEKLETISLPDDTYNKLLSFFIFSFYSKSPYYKDGSLDGVVERALNENRFSREEGLTIALGNYFGESGVETISMFEAPKSADSFMAILEEKETPRDSSLHNRLSFERIMLDKTTLHQIQKNYTSDEREATSGNYIVVKSDLTNDENIIDPSIHSEEYIKNCVEFYSVIGEGLETYRHLDG